MDIHLQYLNQMSMVFLRLPEGSFSKGNRLARSSLSAVALISDMRMATSSHTATRFSLRAGKGSKPQIRVMEDDGFGIGVWILCALFVIFMACGLVVMGG